MNENKGIENPWLKILNGVGAKAHDETICWNNTKTNYGRNFQCAKFSVIIWSLPTEEIF